MRPYVIVKGLAQRMIHVRLSGQWDMSIVADYRRDFEAAMQSLAGSTSCIRILIDVTKQGVQPKDVAEAIASMVTNSARFDNPSAIVLPAPALKRMQAKRIGATLTRDRYFEDAGEAITWLLTQKV